MGTPIPSCLRNGIGRNIHESKNFRTNPWPGCRPTPRTRGAARQDFAEHDAIKLKVFLRSDIWSRIIEGGFREASHITNFVVIDWSQPPLLNLVIRRIMSNETFVEALNVDREQILSDFNSQRDLFYRVYKTRGQSVPLNRL